MAFSILSLYLRVECGSHVFGHRDELGVRWLTSAIVVVNDTNAQPCTCI